VTSDHHTLHAFSTTSGSCGHFFGFKTPRGLKQTRPCAFKTHACGYNSVDARAHRSVVCFVTGHADDFLTSLSVEDQYRRVSVADNEVLASGGERRDGCRAGL
jgi:hypothetical protein